MNIIIRCICKHFNMNVNDFSGNYLNELRDKLSKGNKTIFPVVDFYINLINFDLIYQLTGS